MGSTFSGVNSITLPGPAHGFMSEDMPPSASVQLEGVSSSVVGEPVEISAGGGRVELVGVASVGKVIVGVVSFSFSFPFTQSVGTSLLQNHPRQQVFFFLFRFASAQEWAGSSLEQPHLNILEPSLRILQKN